MYENLWNKDGFSRLEEIDKMTLKDYDDVCTFYRKCSCCPFAILYRDAIGYERILCVDVAARKRVVNCLEEGGRFLKKGEKINEA